MQKNTMRQKGISGGVSIVLIIILVIVGLIFIIGFVIPRAGQGITAGSTCFDHRLTINTKAGYTCFDSSSREIRIQVARGPVEYDLVGLQVFAVIDGKTEKFDISEGMLGVNEQNVYIVQLNSSITGNPNFVAIAPIIRKQGTTVTCGIAARAELIECI